MSFEEILLWSFMFGGPKLVTGVPRLVRFLGPGKNRTYVKFVLVE